MASDVDPTLDDPDAHDGPYPPDWAARSAAVLDRDDHACVRCGTHVARADDDPGNAPVERIVPTWRGGTNRVGNLLALCADCTRRRRADGLPVVIHEAIETSPDAPAVTTTGPGEGQTGIVATDASGDPDCPGPARWSDPDDGWDHLLVPAPGERTDGAAPSRALCGRSVRVDPEPGAAALFGAIEPTLRSVLGRSRAPAVATDELERIGHDADPLAGDRVCGECAGAYRDPTWSWPVTGEGYRLVAEWAGTEAVYEPVEIVLAGGEPDRAERDVGPAAPPVYDPVALADHGVSVVLTDRLGRLIRLDPDQVAGMAYDRVVP